MDVKNNIIHAINNYNMQEINLSQYGSNTVGIEINRDKIIPVNVESSSSSDNFQQSKENNEYNKKDLDNALKKINNFLKDEKAYAEYSVHEDLGTIMIKVINDETKEVILEVQPEKILDMVASMCKQVGLLDKKV